MNQEQILKTLREEAEQHTPDIRTRVLAAAETPPQGDVLVKTKTGGRKTLLTVLAAFLALLIILSAVLFGLSAANGGGGGSGFRIVVSINPCVEFTVTDGKVSSTRSLNRDAAVLLLGEDFTGQTAEDACLHFAALADSKHLIGADGIRLRVEGQGGDTFERVRGRLAAQYSLYGVSEIDEQTYSSLMNFDERSMGDFEDWLEREFENKREAFEAEIGALLERYPQELRDLDVTDREAVNAFNATYLKLGDDLIFEDGDETKEELMREYEELYEMFLHYPARAMDELFDEFLDEIEDIYDRDEKDDDDRHRDDDDDDDDD